MKNLKLIMVLILGGILFQPNVTIAQDTLSIYFSVGNSKITRENETILNKIQIDYDLSLLDSVYFIGMADSTGKFKSNLKLSEKRAKNAYKYCESMFNPQSHIVIKAMGEVKKVDLQAGR